MNKKLWGFVICSLFILIIFSSGCISQEKKETEGGSYSLEVLPEVRTSNYNYNETTMGNYFWDLPVWENFTDTYAGKYSDSLKDAVIDNMKSQAENLNLDQKLLEDCINGCGEFDEPEYHVALPCLAELAKFQDNDVWIIVFAWGMDTHDLGHIRYYAVDINTLETLHFETCG
jgi:hypothetical protein